ncbi:hypothetical protein [Sphaerothrix gracilis]|uniref:hypothetical protein n=1 Tax=Sphaerothrix gracilis TaxID=3151835 RepID=UPI0031FD9BD6
MTEKANNGKSSRRQPHLELTTHDVLQLWREGHYTPKGYLYHLILAHRKAGWWFRIANVSEFCRKWEIQRRTFYRAKACLIENGQLEESIVGAVDLRIPVVSINTCDSGDTPVTNESLTVSDLSPTVTNGSHSVTDGSHMSPESLTEQSSCNSTDLSQISYKSFSAHPPASEEREIEIKKEIDPEFRNWLNKKASRLPTPPTLREQWIRKQAQVEANQEEFSKWKQQTQSRKTALPPSPPEQNFEQPTPEQRLARYQQQWASPVLRPGIQKAIAANPQWGFDIGLNGPRNTPETSCNDLSPLLVAIDAEIGRLGWSEATLSERLYQWFVKYELSSLIDDQLYELLELLKEIHEPMEVAS